MLAQNSRTIVLAGLAFALAACGQQEAPPAQTQPVATEEPTVELTPEQLTERRVADIVAINNALQAYHQQHGNYPASPRGGFVSIAHEGATANWIPELVPTFIAALPREPLNSANPNRPQYQYASDGVDYKLIVHGIGEACDPSVERNGVRMDPARTRNGRCWAFGFWTAGKERW